MTPEYAATGVTVVSGTSIAATTAADAAGVVSAVVTLDAFAKRQHLRMFKLTQTYNGQDVRVGAVTHEIATGNNRAGSK